MSTTDLEKIHELHRLLDEAYEHYYRLGDGIGKSSEGHISVDYGNYFDRQDEQGVAVRGVEVYSYVFGPHREHYFDSLDQALVVVREWHACEMGTEYDEHGDIVRQGPRSTAYDQIEAERDARMRADMDEMDRLLSEDEWADEAP